MTRISRTAAGRALSAHHETLAETTLAQLFEVDGDRFAALSWSLDGLLLDLSKNRLTPETMGHLVALARESDLEEWRRRMFAGEAINVTEDRAVLHVGLRDQSGLTGGAAAADAAAAQARMAQFVADVREGRETGVGGRPFRHVIGIGIGGSYLGPAMAVRAAADGKGPAVRFAANVDGAEIAAALAGCDPAETLFLVASKSFTTQESLANAATARSWLGAALGSDAVAAHFVALTAAPERAAKFGIPADRVFPLWDWVGGRFSVWSSVGLPAAMAMGWDGFDEMLAGAHAVDRHFLEAPLEANLPVLLALAGIWNTAFEDLPAHAVVPYDERLADLPAFLQQLEMESNGKSVDRDGAAAATGQPVVFGHVGTNAQHAFHQWLHQGPRRAAVDFIAAARPGHDLPGHHEKLLANMLAQAEALAFGTDGGGDAHRACPGNRPSTTILLAELDARRLGMLIALYEHKVFVQGLVWGVNSFDQFGVELGKQLAARLLPELAVGDTGNAYDSSTAGLLAQVRSWRDGGS